MSTEQQKIYQDYTLTLGDIGACGTAERKGLFGALQFLSKLCIHPMLVNKSSSAHCPTLTLEDSPKLVALRDILLEDCQVGTPLEALDKDPHRVLVFAQHKSTLDIIQSVLLTPHMPHVPIMRIDGGTEAMERFQIATTFNSDPTIRILLLTTSVGGLGLNLTGADTVVFFEHDWNPMKDLQAMDRVHRLGQRRTVNVYRLIMEGTVEEKILSSQKFKLHVANSVVNQQNVAISSMAGDDGEEFDVAELLGRSKPREEPGQKAKGGKITLKELLEELEEDPENDSEVVL
jgi:TATA-binding protein-associated factor